jgi:hypothetical protein
MRSSSSEPTVAVDSSEFTSHNLFGVPDKDKNYNLEELNVTKL